jgi:hypothetical protein
MTQPMQQVGLILMKCGFLDLKHVTHLEFARMRCQNRL